MTRLFLAAIVFVWAATFAYADAPNIANRWNGANIDWKTFHNGLAEARSTNKPILVVFHTTWCPHCRRYRRQFYNRSVVKLSRSMVMVLVDRDTEADINARYGAYGVYIPRTMVLSPRGRLVSSLTGRYKDYPHLMDTDSPGDLQRMMKSALAKYPG